MKVKNNRKKVFKEYMTDSETPSTTSEPQPGDPVTSKEWKSIGYLVLVCVILIVLSFVAAFFTRKEKGDGIRLIENIKYGVKLHIFVRKFAQVDKKTQNWGFW